MLSLIWNAPLSLNAGELHPKLMAIAGILMLAGAQGGALFRGLLTGSFLDSEHAKTAIAGLGLLFGQGILGKVCYF